MCTRALLTKLILLLIHNTCDSTSRQIHLARLGNHINEYIFISQRFLRSFLEHKNISKSNSTEKRSFSHYLDLKTTTNEQCN